MADHYVKLWASITDSSIWSQPAEERIVWVTMLTMADEHGFVGASVDGLARRANVTIEAAKSALAKFMSPDDTSRNKENEGRRIMEVPRGWHILNHAYFRDLKDREARKLYETMRKREQRARARGTVLVGVGHGGDSEGQHGTHASLSPLSAHEDEDAGTSPSEKVQRPLPSVARPQDVSEEVWGEFLAIRRRRRAPLTPRAWAAIEREAAKAKLSLEQALTKCIERNWQTFEAEWLEPGHAKAGTVPRRLVAMSTQHIPNMPLGTPNCACEGCVNFRSKKETSR